jgi:hypothetical protein
MIFDNIIIMYVVVFFCQFFTGIVRIWNIGSIGSKNRRTARLSWFLFGCVYLIGTTIGIRSVMEADFIGIAVWFAGSMLGQEFFMRKWK